jgi:hypothetical protein
MAPTCPGKLIKAKVQFESFSDVARTNRDVRFASMN